MRNGLIIFVAGLLLGLGFATLGAGAQLWWPMRIFGGSKAAQTATEADLIKEKIDNYSKRADDLQKLLSILVTISTIYALAIGYNAYKQAEESKAKLDILQDKAEKSAAESKAKLDGIAASATQSADKAEQTARESHSRLDQIFARAEANLDAVSQKVEREADRIHRQVYEVFPIFENMELRTQRVMADLVGMLPRLDISEKKFERLTDFDKQRILFYEKTVAAWEFLDPRPLKDDTVAEIFHSLGNFYALKAGSEKDRANAKGISQTEKRWIMSMSDEDRERSRYYLERALGASSWHVGTLNDRGYLALALETPPAYADARGLFERSLRADAQQQRARYNLALALHNANPPEDEAAIRLLNDALNMPRWQTFQELRRIAEILYNRACFRVCLAKFKSDDERAPLHAKAMADLEDAFSRQEIDWPSVGGPFLDDLQPAKDNKPAGDLWPLVDSPQFKAPIAKLEEKVRQVLRMPKSEG